MHTAEQKRVAVATYRRHKSYAKTLRLLGYPSRHVLFDWVRGSRPGRKKPIARSAYRSYSVTVKLEAVNRMLAGEPVVDVAAGLDVANHMLLYKWMHAWHLGGEEGLMTRSERKQREGYRTRAQPEASLPDDPVELRRLSARLLVGKAVLEKELDLVKKDAGVIPGQLTNTSKTIIIQSLRDRLALTMLLDSTGLRANSYQYARTALARPDRLAGLRASVHEIARSSGFTYGSPRVWMALKRAGIVVSEKVVRRVMKQERIPVHYAHRKWHYSSYEGESTPAPKDLVKRDFHAREPNRLWLTDVSEFAARNGKVYLSPIIDCHDGKAVSFTTGRCPDKRLTQSMLEQAIGTLPTQRTNPLIIHSDGGGHYRAAEWIETLNAAGVTRSMSRKGCSPDNATCEGFFGRMKTEMFHERTWNTMSELETAIHWYMDFILQPPHQDQPRWRHHT
ncbi:IS3 family transposase [Bifidobacterium aquikefiricola]|uniref:IS3 family transposase n=1 Tax=Bifidobacterium aquikefiricola TaxID=3059038 RepID=A0AB39U6A5_9BIFI